MCNDAMQMTTTSKSESWHSKTQTTLNPDKGVPIVLRKQQLQRENNYQPKFWHLLLTVRKETEIEGYLI